MSQPYDFPPDSFSDTSKPYGSAPTLIKLAFIFNYICAGLHFIAAIGQIALIFFIPSLMNFMKSLENGPSGSTMPAMPPPAMFAAIYAAYSVFAFITSILTFIAARKLQARSRWAFGLGLTAGIINCFGIFWCSIGCVLPLASGIFTIVAVSLENSRRYLRDSAATPGSPPNATPSQF